NFDNRSFRLNFELTLLVHDKIFAAKVDDMLQADFRRSRQVSLEEIESKPVWFPMAMAVAKLFSPVL
ncbi:MAG: cardiolipin synthase, partial [Pseudomonadota bacterium]